jgi:hypothetical protein
MIQWSTLHTCHGSRKLSLKPNYIWTMAGDILPHSYVNLRYSQMHINGDGTFYSQLSDVIGNYHTCNSKSGHLMASNPSFQRAVWVRTESPSVSTLSIVRNCK